MSDRVMRFAAYVVILWIGGLLWALSVAIALPWSVPAPVDYIPNFNDAPTTIA